MKQLLYTIAAIPALALIGGIGILAYRIGETWNATTTQSLVTGLTVVCGGGILLCAILVACIVGVPLAIRAYGEGGASRRQWTFERDSRGRQPALPDFDDWPHGVAKRPPPMIEGQWSRMPDYPTTPSSAPPAMPHASPSSPPPWGMTGGGNAQLLPPVEQDDRFGVA